MEYPNIAIQLARENKVLMLVQMEIRRWPALMGFIQMSITKLMTFLILEAQKQAKVVLKQVTKFSRVQQKKEIIHLVVLKKIAVS